MVATLELVPPQHMHTSGPGEAPEDEVSETLPELDDRLGSGHPTEAVSPSGSDLKTPPPRDLAAITYT